MQKPRIAILHYAAPPTIGGVEATIAAHARLFAENRYPVRIIAGRGELFDPRVRVEIIADAGSIGPRVSEVNAELAQGIVSERFHTLTRDLSQALAPSLADCDVLIVHNALSLHKNLALTAALKKLSETRRLKFIAWCHDFAWSDPQYAGDLHPGFPYELLKQPWAGVKYVVVSAARKEDLFNLWQTPAEIAVVPAGIAPCEFLGVTRQMADWVDHLALRDAAPLLLLPARLTRRKNIEYAIEITAALRARAWNAKLVVTGPPGPHNPTNIEYLERLRMLRKMRGVEAAVIFLHDYGTVDDAMRRDLFLLADALLFPSEREGFGIPLLEAGLTRLPIFCADLPPFRASALEHAHYFAHDDAPDGVAARISEYLSRDSAYQLKQRVLQEYGWERIFSEYIEPLVIGG
ncbi:MAG: glycosyltransferase family 4 protein [Chloroflexota bacterium]|nr:glycosyltransferase family 4 protein [Chloroflexota bacterium]